MADQKLATMALDKLVLTDPHLDAEPEGAALQESGNRLSVGGVAVKIGGPAEGESLSGRGNHALVRSQWLSVLALVPVLVGAALFGRLREPEPTRIVGQVYAWADPQPDAFLMYRKFFSLRVIPRAERVARDIRQLRAEVEQGAISPPQQRYRNQALTRELVELYDTTTQDPTPTIFFKPAVRLAGSTASFARALQELESASSSSGSQRALLLEASREQWDRGSEQLQYASQHIRMDVNYTHR